MKCLYHRGDFDGKCSAAIVKLHEPQCELIGLDYQDKVTFDELGIAKDEEVFLVDFSFEPVARMLELHERADLLWIDHHRTAIDAVAATGTVIEGTQTVGLAACELTWGAFSRTGSMPWAVHLLGRYDVWDHRNPAAMNFQYGMRARGDWDPNDTCAWSELFSSDALVRELIEHGRDVIRYEDAMSERYAREFAWHGRLVSPAGEALPLHVLCLNRGLASSKSFSVCDEYFLDVDVYAAYVQLPDGRLKVSLFKPEHWRQGCGRCNDVGALAEMFGGGGHAGAAGFVCDELPFVKWWENEMFGAAVNGGAGLDEGEGGAECLSGD